MEKLRVDLGKNSYDICFTDSFDGLSAALEGIGAPKKLLLVTDTTVAALYSAEVKSLLKDYDCGMCVLKSGEEYKNMRSILKICEACIAHGLDRNSMILALGGGVVGDMAGFAASIYMRGIPYVQIPTTLLAQSDSSVGGKTGIDFKESKNILGAFHQPKLVYINVNTLRTLPDEQFDSGMGEVIKHGIIRDEDFFRFVRDNEELIQSLDSDTLIKMSKTNCGIKANVVEQDERETGLRVILNFGHTIGHALESAFEFQKTHGICVDLGMKAAVHIAHMRGMLDTDTVKTIMHTISAYGCPVRLALPEREVIREHMHRDKKQKDGKLTFILPDAIGHVIRTNDVTYEEIEDALDYIDVNAEKYDIESGRQYY